MKLKKILAGLIAGAMAASLAVQTAGADPIDTYKLYDDIYYGTVTVKGTLKTGVSIDVGDRFFLANGPAVSNAYSGFSSAVSAAGGLTTGTKKESSLKGAYVFGGTNDLKFSAEKKNGKYYIGNAEWSSDTAIRSDLKLVGAKIGDSNAVIATSQYQKDTLTSGGSGPVMWVVEPVDNQGLGGISSNTASGQKTLNFSFTFEVKEGGSNSVAKALYDAKGEDPSAIAGENTFTIIWAGGTNKFTNSAAGTALTPFTTASSLGNTLDAYRETNPAAWDSLINELNTAILANGGTALSTSSDLADDLSSAMGAWVTAYTNILNYYGVYASGGVVNAGSNYNTNVTNITGSSLDFSGLKVKKDYNKAQVNMIAQTSDAKLYQIGAAAKKGQSLYVTFNLSEAVKTDYAQIVFGYAPFAGVNANTQITKTGIKKGDTSIVLEIPAADVWDEILGWKTQYLYYIKDADGQYDASTVTKGWNKSGDQNDSDITGVGFSPSGGEKDQYALIVETITIDVGAPGQAVSTTGYPATWAGATQAVKDALSGKTTWPTATSAVKAVLK